MKHLEVFSGDQMEPVLTWGTAWIEWTLWFQVLGNNFPNQEIEDYSAIDKSDFQRPKDPALVVQLVTLF